MFISCSVSLSRVPQRMDAGGMKSLHEKLNNLTRRCFIAASYYSSLRDVYPAAQGSVTWKGQACVRLSKLSGFEQLQKKKMF